MGCFKSDGGAKCLTPLKTFTIKVSASQALGIAVEFGCGLNQILLPNSRFHYLEKLLEYEWSRTRGPIGPGKYGYGKAPYILPLQTDTTHMPQRLRRQKPSSRHSRSQEAWSARLGYSSPAHPVPQHGPLYQSDSGPRSGLQAAEAPIYQLPLTHDQGFQAASSLFHSPETSNNHGVGTHGAAQSFSQPARSTAISCIGAYRQYKLCNTNVSTHNPYWAWKWLPLLFLSFSTKHDEDSKGTVSGPC
ncbi:Thrombospondin type-1 domain-containing protein 4 [Saguinus oedipus]|uniref:Thrombospondin type-1 domain-containing protein 4 n=1 Tax=Saguinus oedipus TaxID=9490 RepID=A0ABQ9V2P1_SAGOE|nr:Thrombospondin type-1 domain-containing protein 4 [Saguinus oedipus]